MDRLRSLLTLSVSRQAVLTGAVSAMMLGGTAAALVLRVADLPAPDPEKSATAKRLKIAIDEVPQPAATRQPKMATVAPAPGPLPFNPAETALAAPRPQAAAPPAAAPRLEAAVAPARLRPEQPRPQQRLGASAPVAGDWAVQAPPTRAYVPPSALAVAPQPPQRGSVVRPGRPTDALAEARRAGALQAAPEDERVYADEERGVDPRDDEPPPGRRGRPVYPQQAYPQQAYRQPVYRPPAYRQPAGRQGYAADPYADRYPDPYADRDPDPYADYGPYQRRR